MTRPQDAANVVQRAATRLTGASLRVMHALAALDANTADGFGARASGTQATGDTAIPGTDGYTSPVERTAFVRDYASKERRRMLRIINDIDALVTALDEMTRTWQDKTPITTANSARSIIRDRGCRSCARIGVWTEVRANRMCDWCNSFHATYKTLPPVDLVHEVKVHHRRLTSRQVATSLAAARAASKRRR